MIFANFVIFSIISNYFFTIQILVTTFSSCFSIYNCFLLFLYKLFFANFSVEILIHLASFLKFFFYISNVFCTLTTFLQFLFYVNFHLLFVYKLFAKFSINCFSKCTFYLHVLQIFAQLDFLIIL